MTQWVRHTAAAGIAVAVIVGYCWLRAAGGVNDAMGVMMFSGVMLFAFLAICVVETAP